MGGRPVPKNARDKKIFVGDPKKPIAFIKRSEVDGYVNDEEFRAYYHCWKRLSSGMGLPYGDGWAQYPELFNVIIEAFTREIEAVRK
jgi:hypothetical protein